MKLITERLILRPWCISDAEDLFAYAKDDKIGPIAGWAPHRSVAESKTIIETVFSQKEVYAVALKENDRAIGCIGLLIGEDSNISIAEDEAEVAYWIGVPYWGQGLIPEALERLIAHAFIDLKLSNLWCGFFVENQKSKRAQEKCGFIYDHTIEKQYNAFTNTYLAESINKLTKVDWLKNKATR